MTRARTAVREPGRVRLAALTGAVLVAALLPRRHRAPGSATSPMRRRPPAPDPGAMRTTRISLGLLALQAAVVGWWALLAPRSFYDDFPGFGRHWVSLDGPYSEHLVRDVGSLFLALLVVTAAAWAAAAHRGPGRLVGLAWLAYAVPHLAYHYVHLDVFEPVDRVLNVILLAVTVLLPAHLLLAPGHRRREPVAAKAA